MKTKLKYLIPVLCLMGSLTACVDNDDVVVNYYASTKVTAAGYLEENIDVFSDFIDILKRTPYYSLLSTYGEFTLLAPTNAAIGNYVDANGYWQGGFYDEQVGTGGQLCSRKFVEGEEI